MGSSQSADDEADLVKKASLDLSGRSLTAWPSSRFDRFNNVLVLTSLDLSCNELPELPASVSQLLNLQSLDCSHNQLKCLPSEVGRLVNLRDLALGFNALVCLPDTMGALTQLNSLKLQWNCLQELPHHLLDLVDLQHLDITHCNRRERGSPGSASDSSRLLCQTSLGIPKIRSLIAGMNGISCVSSLMEPHNLILSSLESLSLHLNFISKIDCVQSHNFPALQRLVLDGNEIVTVPTEIRLFTNMRDLFLSCNRLTSCPPSICAMPNLQVLDLSFNMIGGEQADRILACQFSTSLHSLLLYGHLFSSPPDEYQSSHLPALTCLQDVESQEREFAKRIEPDEGRLGHVASVCWNDYGANFWILASEYVSTLKSLGPRAAIEQLYDRLFAEELSTEGVVKVEVLPTITRTTGSFGKQCWGRTFQEQGRQVTVQLREALLVRGPFSLIVLALGHELVHARQFLGGHAMSEAQREFEAFSWMLLEGRRCPPLIKDDRTWIMQRAEEFYVKLSFHEQQAYKDRRDLMLRLESDRNTVLC